MRRRAIRHHCKVRMTLKIRRKNAHMDTWTVEELPLQGRILDLSEEGCSVFSRDPIEMGQELGLVVVQVWLGVVVPAQGVHDEGATQGPILF